MHVSCTSRFTCPCQALSDALPRDDAVRKRGTPPTTTTTTQPQPPNTQRANNPPPPQILLYTLRGSDMLEAGERPAPEGVTALAWVGPGQLVAGSRRGYVRINTATGEAAGA